MAAADGEETIYSKPVSELQTVLAPYDPEIEALLAGVDSDAIPLRLHPGRFFCGVLPGRRTRTGRHVRHAEQHDQKIYCKGSDLNFRVFCRAVRKTDSPVFLCLRKLQRKQIRILHFELQTDHFPSNRDRLLLPRQLTTRLSSLP